MTESLTGGAAAVPLSMRAAAAITSVAVRAARQLLIDLERGRRIDAAVLRSAMEAAFGASDATGGWNWKAAYDVCEAAVLFATYATLRIDERGEKLSRVRQIVQWLGSDFHGVIVFDESHAMQNAAGGKGERGDQAASQQSRAGLTLQHASPNARVMGAHRIELSGVNDTMRDRLRTYSRFWDIISWNLRMFIPTDISGIEMLSKELDQHLVGCISGREAA